MKKNCSINEFACKTLREPKKMRKKNLNLEGNVFVPVHTEEKKSTLMYLLKGERDI
jgi:hypothetical protein